MGAKWVKRKRKIRPVKTQGLRINKDDSWKLSPALVLSVFVSPGT